MKKKVVLPVIVVFAACAIFVLLFVRIRFQAFASFECATQFDGAPTTAEVRERTSRHVAEAVARFCRSIASRTQDFLARYPEYQGSEAGISNALESCRLEMSGRVDADGEVVNLRVACGNAALACALADFVIRDFDGWLERQAAFSFEKNTASDRIAVERMRRNGIEPDPIRLGRLEKAKRIFERERLKVRFRDSSRIESWSLALPCFSSAQRR